MTNSLKFSRLMAIIMVAILCCSGCKKDKDSGGGGGSGKLSPPAWIQGSWGTAPAGVGLEVFKFTPNDVLQMGVSLKTYAVSTPSGTVTISESKKTDNLYEITLKAKASGKETVSGFYSFKKGDGTFIEFGSDETGATEVEYGRLYKR